MYFVKYGESYLHDPRVDGCELIDLTLDAETNSCGFCDFTIYPENPMYSKIKERDYSNLVRVYEGDALLFSGYIYELGSDFYESNTVKCKGELDFLSESIVRPYSTLERGFGSISPSTVDGYFSWLIDQHNSQVGKAKQFTVGINEGAYLDTNNYIYRQSDEYPNTMDEIQSKIIDELGGYLRVRNEDGKRYIDLLYEWQDVNSQTMRFGINLTDYTQTDDSSEVVTFVIPLGAHMSDTEYSYNKGYFVTSDTSPDPEKDYYTYDEESGDFSATYDLTEFEQGVTYYEYNELDDESENKLDISSLDNGSIGTDYYKQDDYIYCVSAVDKYGMVGGTVENSDIYTLDYLLAYGLASLKSKISPQRTIEIRAIDMHLLNPELKPIKIGEYVRVVSPPHDLDSYFLCTQINLDLINPENSQYTFGTTFDTLTGQQNAKIKSLNATVNKVYEAADKISEEAKASAESAAISKEVAEKSATKSEAVYEAYQNGELNGEDAVLLRIDSSRGTVFKNNSITTVLSVVIYKGSERITDISALHATFGSGAYLEWSWQRLDENAFGVISAADQMISDGGFKLTISAEEVDTKVTFMCELKE